jgi:hypothetical protein
MLEAIEDERGQTTLQSRLLVSHGWIMCLKTIMNYVHLSLDYLEANLFIFLFLVALGLELRASM